jgi:hypothetical protein
MLILVAIHAHCSKRGIKVPWDDIGAEIAPTVTGNAVIQHIAKLRKKREELGKPVPAISVTRKRERKGSSEVSSEDDGDKQSEDSYKGSKHKQAKLTTMKTKGKNSQHSKKSNKKKNSNVKKHKKAPVASVDGDVSVSPSIKSKNDDESTDGEQHLGLGEDWMKVDNRTETSSQESSGDDTGSNSKSLAGSTPKKSLLIKMHVPMIHGDDDNEGPRPSYHGHHPSQFGHQMPDRAPIDDNETQQYRGYYHPQFTHQMQAGVTFEGEELQPPYPGFYSLHPSQQIQRQVPFNSGVGQLAYLQPNLPGYSSGYLPSTPEPVDAQLVPTTHYPYVDGAVHTVAPDPYESVGWGSGSQMEPSKKKDRHVVRNQSKWADPGPASQYPKSYGDMLPPDQLRAPGSIFDDPTLMLDF